MKTDVLIIGGGITGLSLASFINKDYLIIEGSSEVGGYCKTTKRNGFIWDYSGHFFHFNNEYIKNYLIENIDCEILKIKKISDIFYNNQYVDFPFQWNINQLNYDEYMECFVGFCNRKDDKNIKSFKEYVKSTLGDPICDKFIIPYNEKLYSCDLNLLDYKAMGRFFPKEMNLSSLLNHFLKKETFTSYNDMFIYPSLGAFEFVKSILKRLDEKKIHLNTELIEVDFDKKIAITNKGKIEFNTLVSTIPFNRLLKINNSEINDFSWNKVGVFNLGFDSPTPIKTHWTYFPGDEVFYRIGYYNNILNSERMSLYVEIGLKNDAIIDEKKLLTNVLSDLKKCNIINEQKLVDYEFLIMNPAYVHITEKSEKIYNDWCSINNPKNIYSIGRFGSWTYCSIEDNIIQAMDVSKRI